MHKTAVFMCISWGKAQQKFVGIIARYPQGRSVALISCVEAAFITQVMQANPAKRSTRINYILYLLWQRFTHFTHSLLPKTTLKERYL